MQAEKLIQHYNRLNGNAITVEHLKDIDSSFREPFYL